MSSPYRLVRLATVIGAPPTASVPNDALRCAEFLKVSVIDDSLILDEAPPFVEREATQDVAAFVAPRSMGFVLLAAGWTVGLMLWFMQNRFVGSYLFFRVTRRSKLAP